MQLFQEGDRLEGDPGIILKDSGTAFVDNLAHLKKENITDFYIPSDEVKDLFVEAELFKVEENLLRLTIYFKIDSNDITLTQSTAQGQSGRGKTIDIDDFKVNTFSLGDKEVTVFSHKLGLTVFNWEEAEIYYELRGEVDADALTDYAIFLGLFN